MTTELQSLNERIAERIGNDLVDLIPADQWQTMVDAEIHKFKTITAPKIIQEQLNKQFTDKVKDTLNALTTDEWDLETQRSINKALESFIGASSGVIVAGMLSPSMQIVLQDLRGRLGY